MSPRNLAETASAADADTTPCAGSSAVEEAAAGDSVAVGEVCGCCVCAGFRHLIPRSYHPWVMSWLGHMQPECCRTL